MKQIGGWVVTQPPVLCPSETVECITDNRPSGRPSTGSGQVLAGIQEDAVQTFVILSGFPLSL